MTIAAEYIFQGLGHIQTHKLFYKYIWGVLPCLKLRVRTSFLERLKLKGPISKIRVSNTTLVQQD